MAKVKGSLLLEVARMIRANKDRNWDKYLNAKELEAISGRVLASSWYPADLYERASFAIFQEIAGGNLDVARLWGRFVLEDIINRFYPALIQEKDIIIALDRFKVTRQQWFQFDDWQIRALEIERWGQNQARITIRSDHACPFEPYSYQAAGSFERLIELCGKTGVHAQITEHDWESDHPFCIMIVSWKG